MGKTLQKFRVERNGWVKGILLVLALGLLTFLTGLQAQAQATLPGTPAAVPFAYGGVWVSPVGLPAYLKTYGVTQVGSGTPGTNLGTSTSGGIAVFDNSSTNPEELIIHINNPAHVLSYYLTIQNGSEVGSFEVLESATGASWQRLRELGNQPGATPLDYVETGTRFQDVLAPTTKYVKFRYTTKIGGTFVYLDDIKITAGPEINLKAATTDYLTGATYTFAAPDTPVSFTIENTGDETLQLTSVPNSVVISGPDASLFTLTQPAATSLAVGASTTFTLSFTPSPTSYGLRSALITIASNDRDEGTYTINLAGDGGFAPPTISAFLDLSENAITVGRIGDVILIEGSGFTTDLLAVTFAGETDLIPADAQLISDQRIQVTIPGGAVTGNVTVTASGGQVSSSFNIIPPPVISGFFDAETNGNAITAARIGDELYIYGAEFTLTPFAVEFTGANNTWVAASAQFISNTVIKATVPADALTGPVRVTADGGKVNSQSLTIIPLPLITGFSDLAATPITGSKIGEDIFIEGLHFTDDPPVVTFNGAGGPVTVVAPQFVSDQRIRVTVPAGATSGNVTVTADGGMATRNFTIYLPPVISGLFDAETNGNAKPAGKIGDDVYIYGSDFVEQDLKVEYTGENSSLVLASAEFISATVIKTTVPAGAVTGPLKLTTAGGETSSASFMVYPLPTITGFTDFDLNAITGGKAGDEIYIQGTDFTTQDLQVTFTGEDGPITVAAPQWLSAEYIQVQVPQGARTGNVTVTASGGEATRVFTIFPPPQITGIFDAEAGGNAKTSGKIGDVIYIRGSDFTLNGLSVGFTGASGFVTALSEFISDAVIRVTVPGNALTGPIRVTSAGGSVNSEVFTVFQIPTISSFLNMDLAAITGGKEGDEIFIEGTEFSQDPLIVTFNSLSGPITAAAQFESAQRIRVTVPAGATTGDVRVTAAGGEAARSFTIFPVPLISGLFDAETNGNAKTEGRVGDAVYIYGADFVEEGLKVSFTGENSTWVTASAEYISETVIKTIVPANAVTGPLQLTTGGGSANSESLDIIPLPAITGFLDMALNPVNGSKIGEDIYIEGANFTEAPLAVTFTGESGTITVAAPQFESAQRIRVTVPVGAITGNVTVTADGGQASRLFTAFLTPAISGLFDAETGGNAITAGKLGDEVYIYGSNFVADQLQVEYTGENSSLVLASAEFISTTVIKTIVPAGAVTGPLKLTTAGGEASSASFTVYQLPTIAGFTDIDVNTITGGKAGDQIYIQGTNFTDTPLPLAVTFAGETGPITATAQFISGEYILAEVPVGAITGNVTVTAAGGEATRVFTIFPPPQITGIFDAEVDGNAKTSGKIGDVIYIRGSDFTLNGLSVGFTNGTGFVTALSEFISDAVIKVIVPSNAQTGPVRVTSAGGSVNSEVFTIEGSVYTWNGTTSGLWSEAANWTPERTTALLTDELIFDGATTATPTVTVDLGGAQTIGQLKFINDVDATFTVDANQALTIDGGLVGTDFLIDATSSLTVTNAAADAGLAINISSGDQGIVDGAVTLSGAFATAPHRLRAGSANGLVFQTGSTFTTNTTFTGNPFGSATPVSVSFADGSVYNNEAGGSPFGAASPNAVVNFAPLSTYNHMQNTPPDLANRNYGHFVINHAGFTQIVGGDGSLGVTDLRLSSGISFELNLTGALKDVSINGNITVSEGTLSFNPPTQNSFIFVGEGLKTISGAGTFALGEHATLHVDKDNILSIESNVNGSGTVAVTGAIVTDNVNGLWGPTGDNPDIDDTNDLLNYPGAVITYNGTADQKVSPVTYANLVITGNRSDAVTLPAGILQISETFTPASDVSYVTTGSTVDFMGTDPQIIPVFTFENLTISGGSKSLAGNVDVTGDMTMAGGVVRTGDNRIVLGTAAEILNETTDSYIDGWVQTVARSANQGQDQDFGNIGLILNPANADGLSNIVVLRQSGDAAAVAASQDSPVNQPSIKRIFEITGPESGVDVAMTFIYLDRELNGNITGDLHLYKQHADDLWEEQTASSYTYNSNVTTGVNSVYYEGITGFSKWTMGMPNVVLPVELTSFTAKRINDAVELKWTTAMEKNNQGFEVEVSTDAEYYQKVGFVASKNANASTSMTYSFTDDKTLSAGTRYYRLKQVDLDGKVSYFGPKTVFIESMETTAKAFPNPFNDVFTVKYVAEASHTVTLTLMDGLGKKIHEQLVPVSRGIHYLPVQVGNHRPKGVYLLHLSGAQGIQTFKMLKK